jgi:hypothetical protein
MTSTVTQLTPRDSHSEPPHLPPIARDVTDYIRELLHSIGPKQAGQSDICYADLCEGMAAALRTVVAMLARPAAKPVLRPLALLDVAQAEQFVMEPDARACGADVPAAMNLLGRGSQSTRRPCLRWSTRRRGCPGERGTERPQYRGRGRRR